LTQYLASSVASYLNELRDTAFRKIELGTYGNSDSEGSESFLFEIKTRARIYRVVEHILETDYSNIYSAEYGANGKKANHVCIKVALSPDDEDLFQNEAKVLRLLSHKSIPTFLEAIETVGSQFAIVMRFIEGIDLVSLLEKKPDGLPVGHCAWVFERLLSVLGFMHANKVIHGNIEPGNVMIRPYDHNAYLIDFKFSIIDPLRSGETYKGFTEIYSAPEVFAKKSPIPQSDLYSLAKCMIYLLGGDAEEEKFPPNTDIRFVKFIKQFLFRNPMHRPHDAWEMWKKLKYLRDEIEGKERGFKPLVL
jgi:serine/threonine protein kinase